MCLIQINVVHLCFVRLYLFVLWHHLWHIYPLVWYRVPVLVHATRVQFKQVRQQQQRTGFRYRHGVDGPSQPPLPPHISLRRPPFNVATDILLLLSHVLLNHH